MKATQIGFVLTGRWREQNHGKLMVVVLIALILTGRWVSPAYARPVTIDPSDKVLNCLGDAHGSMTATPQTINLGQSATLTWNVKLPSGCANFKFYVGNQLVSPNGSLTVQPIATSTYALRFVGAGASGTVASVSLAVLLPSTVTINANNLTPLLVQALAQPNTFIIVENQVQLDLSNLADIPIAEGVTLWGGRTGREAGPLLYTTTRPEILFHIGGDHVRITGLRIQGADIAAAGDDTPRAIYTDSKVNIEIDHNELYGWSGAAVEVDDRPSPSAPDGRIDYVLNPETVHVHDNYIHHNQHEGKFGYGVAVGAGAYALIERNVFDWNRHAITDDGSSGSGYHAYKNLVLQHGGENHCVPIFGCEHVWQFDIHGQSNCGIEGLVNDAAFNCGTAGHDMDIRYNSFFYTDGPAIKLRGTPELQPYGVGVDFNVFANGRDDAVQQTESGLSIGPNNLFDVDASNEQGLCDFDGDGVNDLFLATGQTWWYSSGGDKPWVYLNTSTKRRSQVSLGYFDSDNRCDVSVDGTVYSGGTGKLKPFIPLPIPAGGTTTRAALR